MHDVVTVSTNYLAGKLHKFHTIYEFNDPLKMRSVKLCRRLI